MCRKQPIPTSFLNNQSLDVFDKMLFAYLRSKTYNSDQYINFYHGNKYLDFELKRGQCFFIISELVKSIGISRGRVEKSLKKIQKTENEMQIEKKPYGCIITWVGYDERVKMKNESEPETKTKQKRNKNEVKSNEYSDKSVESENINNLREKKIPPSLDQVSEYCKERENGIDPEEFISFYASKGWMIGKNKMKDWRAAIGTRERKRKKEQTAKEPTNIHERADLKDKLGIKEFTARYGEARASEIMLYFC